MGKDACLYLLFQRGVRAQGQPLDAASVPPGLREWLGRDFCGTSQWVTGFHAGLAEAIGRANGQDFPGALASLAQLIAQRTASPHSAFECATAIGAALFVAAQCADQLQLHVLSARLRQLSAIFGSYDYQMKGEEYIDQSPWPLSWMEGMEGILRSMAHLKLQERAAEPWRQLVTRAMLSGE